MMSLVVWPTWTSFLYRYPQHDYYSLFWNFNEWQHWIFFLAQSYDRFNSSRLFREPQETPLVLGRIFEQRKLSGWKYRLGEGDQSKRERMKNREKKRRKSAEEKEGENRWRRQVQRWPRHVACQISIYRATKMTKLKRTVRFRWPTANHTPPGLRRFSLPDLFAGGTF